MTHNSIRLDLDSEILLKTLCTDQKIAVVFINMSKEELLFLVKLCLEQPDLQSGSVLMDNFLALIKTMQNQNFLSSLFADEEMFLLLISKLSREQSKKILQKDYLEYLQSYASPTLIIDSGQIDDVIGGDVGKFELGKFLFFQKLKNVDKRIAGKYTPLYDLSYLRINNQKAEKQQETIETLARQISEKDQIVLQLTSDLSRFQKENNLLKKQQVSIEALEKQISEKDQACKQLNIATTALQKKNDSLDKQLETQKVKMDQLDQTIDIQKKDLKDLEETKKKLLEQNKRLGDELIDKKSGSEKESLKKIQELESKLSKLEERNKEQTNHIRDLNRALDEADKSKNTANNYEVGKIQSQLEIALKRVSALENENRELKKDPSQGDLSVLLAKVEKLKERNKDLQMYLVLSLLGVFMLVVVILVNLFFPQLLVGLLSVLLGYRHKGW